MNQYHPNINCAAHSIEWLQARRDQLARLGLSGGINEKRSAHRKAELAAIEAGLKAKGVAVKLVPRTRPLPDSGPADVARPQLHWPPVAPPPRAGLSGYSDAVAQVSSAFNPPRHHEYR